MRSFTLNSSCVSLGRDPDDTGGNLIPATSGVAIELDGLKITKLVSQEYRRRVRNGRSPRNPSRSQSRYESTTYEGTLSFDIGGQKSALAWSAVESGGGIELQKAKRFKGQLLYAGLPDLLPVNVTMIESDKESKDAAVKLQKYVGAAGSFAALFPPHGTLVSATSGVLSALLDVIAAGADNELELGYFGALPDWGELRAGRYVLTRRASSGDGTVEIEIGLKVTPCELGKLSPKPGQSIQPTDAQDSPWLVVDEVVVASDEEITEQTTLSVSAKVSNGKDSQALEFTHKMRQDRVLLDKVLGIQGFPLLRISTALAGSFAATLTRDTEQAEALWSLADPIGEVAKARHLGDQEYADGIDGRVEFIQSLKAIAMELMPGSTTFDAVSRLVPKQDDPLNIKQEGEDGESVSYKLAFVPRTSFKVV